MNQRAPHDLVPNYGISALQLIGLLPQINSRLRVLSLKTYSPTPTLEERLSASQNVAMQCIFRKADNLRNDDKQLPYWESILSAASGTDESDTLINEAIKHDVTHEAFERFELTPEDLCSGALQRKAYSLPENVVIALCSNCRTEDGTIMHLPMMDFRSEPSAQNLRTVKKAIAEVTAVGGAILESGRSYHYLGFSLVHEREWLSFLAKCLLLSPLTDIRYIAHRMLEGIGALRISTCTRKPYMPKVVDFI